MRTTIEIDEDVRSELRKRAADLGTRGYSGLINELLRRHLGLEARPTASATHFEGVLRSVAGTLSDDEAAEMLAEVRKSRMQWRER